MTCWRLIPIVLLIVGAVGCSGGGGSDPPTQPPPGGGNRAPTANLNLDKTHLAYNETVQLTVVASDPDGDQVTFGWSGVRGAITSSGPTSTSATFQAGSEWGAATATVTASDGKGGQAHATAQAYVRNPTVPRFALFPVGTATCGYGRANPEGFVLRITPEEAVVLKNIAIRPRNCGYSPCGRIRSYASAPISIGAGQEFVWSDGGCQTMGCCVSQDCGSCNYWTVEIQGHRPEPDGGTFTYSCASWNPSYPNDGCN
jgi:hypothetical protein